MGPRTLFMLQTFCLFSLLALQPGSRLFGDGTAELRVFPSESRIVERGPLFTLEAPGYYAKEIPESALAGKLLEAKLERQGSALRLAGMLPAGVQPKSISVSPDGMFLAVPLLNDRGIDLYTAAPLARVKRISPPDALAGRVGFVESVWLERRCELWVSQMTTARIHRFDAADFSYLGSIRLTGSWSKVLSASPDESRVYVSNWLSEDISVVDTERLAEIARIPVGGIPRGMALSLSGEILVTTLYDTGDIVLIDTATLRVLRTIAGKGGAMRHVVRHPERNLFYASDMRYGTVYRFSPDAAELASPLYLGPKINTVALSPDGRYLYASSRGPNNPEDYTRKGPEFGKLFVVDTEAWELVDWTWGGNQPTGLAVSPAGDYLYFSDFLDGRIEIYRHQRDETSGKSFPVR